MSDNETHEQGPNEAVNQAGEAADGTGTGRGWRPGYASDQPAPEYAAPDQPAPEHAASEQPAPAQPAAGQSAFEQPASGQPADPAGTADSTTAEVPEGPAPLAGTAQYPQYQPSDPYRPYGGDQAANQTGGYRTGGYQAGSYQAPGGYQGPYQGAEGRPTSFPTAQYPAYPGVEQQRPQRAGMGRLLGVGLLLLAVAVGGGVAGGVITHHYDTNGTTASANGGPADTAPIIDRSSLASIAAAVRPSVVSIVTSNAEGSGVIISDDGYILTNNHVAATAQGQAVSITFSDGSTAKAVLVGTDAKTDLAVFKAQNVSKKLTVAKFGDSNALRVGDTVLAIGSPLGLDSTVTAGIVSALNRTIDESPDSQPQSPFNNQNSQSNQPGATIAGAIQTDAAINPGNSGGALVNTNGEVVGINTAIATNGNSEGSIGVGFAIPSNRAKTVAQDLINGTKVSHPQIGIGVVTADGNAGAQVQQVTAGSPGAAAGLKVGDLITAYDGKPVHTSDDLINFVQAGTVGSKVPLTVVRGGQTLTVTVTLGEAK
ncbi:MAG TPA: trypsin-like peptidase domain-containing protein [Micromonosporaceae bacterium]|nr:trypsin-like peptidase domain-containing protein [Micromonosporaceae bacterium]